MVKRHTHIMSQQLTAAVTFLSAFLVVGFSAPQQNAGPLPPQQPEIRGVVLEPGTNQPVVDAEIELSVPGTLAGSTLYSYYE
jgi:hypothetical protein